jgi:elongation factor G
VITKLDHARASYQNALAAAQNAFGDKVLPLYLPTGDGVIGLLSQTHYEYANGKRTTHPPDASHADQIEETRGTLIEGIIEESEDESLMERYLGGEKIDEAVLIDDLEKAVARGSFFPVIPVCSGTGVGTLELLEIATRGFPSPAEHPLPEVFTAQGAAFTKVTCGSESPLLAEVVKTTSDPYVGRLSLVRVFSGTIRPDTTVHVSGHFSSFFGSPDDAGPDSLAGHVDHDEDERIGALSFPLGKQQRPASMVLPGDMCAIGRLSRAETGDTLSDKAQPLVLKPWMMPESLLPVAIQAHAKTDEDKLAVGLGRLAAEDPTLRIEQRHRGYRRAAGTAARNLWQQGERPRPARQTIRWSRSVRGLRHRGRTAARRVRVRVPRQGGRRRGAAPVHPERREGRARSDGKGCARRLSRR